MNRFRKVRCRSWYGCSKGSDLLMCIVSPMGAFAAGRAAEASAIGCAEARRGDVSAGAGGGGEGHGGLAQQATGAVEAQAGGVGRGGLAEVPAEQAFELAGRQADE